MKRSCLPFIALWALLALTVHANLHNDVINITLEGTYTWQLLLDIDNSQNAGTVRREVKVETSLTTSYHRMAKTIEDKSRTISGQVDLGGSLFEVIRIGVLKGSLNSDVKSHYEQMTDEKKDYSKKSFKHDVYEVGPRSKLTLYQLVFNGPGITFLTETLSSHPRSKPVVPIEFKVRQIYVLQDIEVVYTDDSISRPADLLTEVHGHSPNTNHRYGGKHVWLVPKWTKKASDGATGIQLVIQPVPNIFYKDLSKGAGGDYRYIKILKDPKSRRRVTELALFRGWLDEPTKVGWEFQTIDINQGRKKDYLYIVYKTRMI